MFKVGFLLRARLYRASESKAATVLIEDNGVTKKWVATPIGSDSIAFNENSITSIIAELLKLLSLTIGVNGP